jgi:cytochrome c556
MGHKQIASAVLVLGMLGAGDVLAQDQPKATGVVAVRQAAMKANGDHMAAIKAILTEYPELIGQVEFHAEAVKETAEYAPTMFPPGSSQPASWALPTVDSDQAGFKAAAEKAEKLAEKLVDSAKGGDAQATLAAFAALGKEGCGGCHQTFRKKDS